QEALIVHVRAAEDAAAISAAAAANDKVSAVRMSGEGMAALAALKESNKGAFDFGPETVKEDAPKGLDEKRAVLVTFADGTPAEKHVAFAEAFGLNIGKAGYDGNPNMVLYELPEVEDVAHFMNMLGEAAAADPDMPVLRIQAYLESDATPPVDVAEKAAAQEEEAGAGAEVQGRQQVAHRDAHTEWITFLQNQKLADGTSFTPKQVEAIAGFFRPVVPPAGERKHPVIGRTDEMKRVIPILSSPRGMINSVMLTGEAGTGKTAIFEGLAQLIEDAEHADQLRVVNGDGETSFLDIRRLRGRWFVQLDIDRLLASEDPINTLLGLLDLLPMLNDPDPRQGNRVILLLDEIQKLRMDPQGVKIMNALKTPIRDGKISIAGTTTEKEWKEYFDPDEALTSRFKRFKIDEPSVAETTEMLQGAKVYYEWMHDTEIDEEALDKAAHLTDQFDKEHKNPRKSVELIHSASEMARPDNIRAALALDIREHWRQLTVAVRKAAKALHQKGIASSIALPAEMYNRMAELVESTLGMYRQQEAVKDGKGTLTLEVLKRTLAENTGIDSGQLSTDKDDSARYVEMEKEIAKTVINQDKALLALANAIRRNKAGLSGGGQPMGKFLFAGPTGVGKTYIAKQLARFMFGSEKAYTRFDMSEFKESHNVARLIGSPPGYVGHGEGGQLTEAVRKKPYSVLLFDEIEKAHPTIWDIFLQVLDDGHLTDGEGRTVDFSNTIIIFTSNVGMDVVDSQGFSKRIQEQQQLIKEIDAVLEGKALDTETKKARAEAEAAADGERERLKALRLVAKREAEDALAAVETLAAELKTTPLPQLEPKLKEKRTLEAQYQRAWDVYLQLGERIKSVTAEAAPVAAADKSELLAQKKAAAGLIAELEKAWDQEIATAISEGIQARMRPEVINRLDEDPLSKDHWITFNRLNRANADAITKIELGRFKKLLGERHGTELEYDDDTIAFLAEYGFSPVYGARPLKQAIEKFVIDPLAQWILKEANDGANNVIGGRIRAYVDGGKIAFESLPVNEEKIERASLAGVAHDMTEAVMELVEKLAGDDSGGAPGEQLFDQLLREFRQEAGEYEEQSGEAAGVQLAFAPNAGIRLSKSAVTVESEHNNPGKKDKTMRGLVSQAAAEAKAAGYSPDEVELLKPEAGAQCESWLKSFIKQAKTMSGDAETKVSVSREIGDKALRIAVKTGHRMSAE
ncbi:MAG: ATP-dependent Clp protease ATP-binding subunit, partial [Elusimicrobiota bacterium]